ncbi:MAG: SLBB domain-containing protein [candidate division KSB1 bacterium]|nr:SLBB domain-containing protein [candidate division KSB1 bacterium]MDZ7367390.1 SLBB domain-containing protein [candidate division KSB1 bacterium]MDZ7405271.1 SLBB domain-containing protein [candidate division KSB1 bacterium]
MKFSRKSRGKGTVSLFLATVLFLFIPSFSTAQDEDDQRDNNRGAQYILGAQDELLIRVNIWGFVRKPGQYMVPKNTDLISLISFAGGPLEQAKIKKVKIIRSIDSIPSSSSSNNRFTQNELLLASRDRNVNMNTPSAPAQQVIKVDIKKYIETGQQALIPELRPGDTIVVPGSTLHFLGKALDFASKFAVIAQIYFWINVADRR